LRRAPEEYSTIDGPQRLKALTLGLLFGSGSEAVQSGRVASVQAPERGDPSGGPADLFRDAALRERFARGPPWRATSGHLSARDLRAGEGLLVRCLRTFVGSPQAEKGSGQMHSAEVRLHVFASPS